MDAQTQTNKKNVSDQVHTYLSFRLGKEVFAASVNHVVNILELKPITKVPHAPEYMSGVINLRGQVLPVIDMRIKFGMTPTEPTVDTCIIVLNLEIENEEVKLGILVDAVSEVLELEENQIEPSPSIGTKYKAEFIKGMWKKDESFIMLLNLDLIFTRDEIVVVEEKTNEADMPQNEETGE
ncbi:MAG TPA: chemotaxis protein CheW [Salinivirga sp.]|uniref:chemotaxis protein CheW n=1 Tax=Salinivirga sp. TaxID=1970192 RepID=UPI002B47CD4B|nr:chemotaxis protein CheW [Salinivirga sp.]HKK60258.1 chemotaxis protein CheW [Salinivirga sp.]